MKSIIKIATLTFFIPTFAGAATCGANDTACHIKESQIAAMERIGIQPSPIQKADSTPLAAKQSDQNTYAEPEEATPFKIPPPRFVAPPTAPTEQEPTAINQNNQATTSAPTPQAGVPLNIFAPAPNAAEPSQSNTDATNQQQNPQSTAPTVPNYQQPMGIQYR